MTRTPQEAIAAVNRVRSMPTGPARSTAMVAELDRIVAEGPDEVRAYALFAAVEAYAWGREVERAYLPFAQLLRWWDEHPEHFDDVDQHALFWSFKWMVSHLMDFPTISADQVEATLADMERRYAIAGNGMDAVALCRYEWATMRGTPDAEALFDAWCATPRDDFSQCEACDPGGRAAHLFYRKDFAGCIDLIERTLPNGVQCASEPADMYSYLQLAYVETGDRAGAARAHRAGMQHLPADIALPATRGRHLQFLAQSGNHDLALARLEEDARHLVRSETPYARWSYLRSAGIALGILRRRRGADPIDLPEVPATTIASLDDWVRAEALDLAAQFDARNGTPALTRRSRAGWADPTILDVDLSVFARPGADALLPSTKDAIGPTPDPSHAPSGRRPDAAGRPARIEPEASGAPPGRCDPAVPPPTGGHLSAEELTAQADASDDPVDAANLQAEAAAAWRERGRLDRAGFAHAEAGMLASAAGDGQGACDQFRAAVSLLRAANTGARFVGPVVRAWCRRAHRRDLPDLLAHVDALIADLAGEAGPGPVATVGAELAQREDEDRQRESLRLRDTRARILATLGEPAAADEAEAVAEEFGRRGDYRDAAYAFWLVGTLHAETQPDAAVFPLESALEGFELAHDAAARRLAANDLVEVLHRLGRSEDATALATSLDPAP